MTALRITRVLAAAAIVVGGSVLAAAPASAQGYVTVPVASISSSTVAAGQDVTVVGSNFNPGEVVTGTLFSTPRPLGTQVANAAGQVSFTFSTAGLEAGPHTVLLNGNQGNTASVNFTVVAPGQGSGIPGANAPGSGNGSGSSGSGSNGSGSNGSGSNGTGAGSTGTGSGSTGTGSGSTGYGSSYTASSIDTGNPGEGSGPNGALIGGGIVLVAAAAAGGVVVVRRRNAA